MIPIIGKSKEEIEEEILIDKIKKIVKEEVRISIKTDRNLMRLIIKQDNVSSRILYKILAATITTSFVIIAYIFYKIFD